MKKELWILGNGLFASVVKELIINCKSGFNIKFINSIEDLKIIDDCKSPHILLSLYDGHEKEKESKIQKISKKFEILYLRAYLYGDCATIGPWVFPKESGCITCVNMRLLAGHPHQEIWQSINVAKESMHYRQAIKVWSVPFLEFIGFLILEELEKYQKNEPLIFHRNLYVGFDSTFKGQLHSFLPNPTCPDCGKINKDHPQLANINFRRNIKPDVRQYRLPNKYIKTEFLKERFFDWRTGVFKRIFRLNQFSILPVVSVDLALPNKKGGEMGFGRGISFNESELIAMLEGLERYAGLEPRGKITTVRGSYKQLKELAANPRDFGLHNPNQYNEPGYRLIPYNENLEFNWIWAYSWKKKKPILMPEQIVYYGLNEKKGSPVNRFVFETSNGCAVGSSIEEAIYFALMEVIERDAFLVSWYNRLNLTELSVEDTEDKSILLMLDCLESLGLHVRLFDMTMDSGIPSIWAMIINKNKTQSLKFMSAAGANPNPEKAIKGALVEAITSMLLHEKQIHEQLEYTTQMIHDNSLVQNMSDHMLLSSHPDIQDRYNFLLNNDKRKKPLKEMYSNWYTHEPSEDLTEELKQLMNRIICHNKDILIVDQTTPEMNEINVKAVRVAVQGMLPMTFGQQYRRLIIDRVQKAPVIAGYREKKISIDLINEYPHPFP